MRATTDKNIGRLRPVVLETAFAVSLLFPCMSAAVASTVTTSFDVTGAVGRTLTYRPEDLKSLPPQTATVTYLAGNQTVSAAFTGPTLWSVIGKAGLRPVAGAKNSTLRNVVVATGSDGYAVAFSGGELDPKFGGLRSPDLVSYAENGQPLNLDGFARTVVPGDARGGRYVSNLSNINVVQSPSNPSRGGGRSSSFTLSGLVSHPATYDAASLGTFPSQTESVTYTSAGQPVSARFTGVSLWGLLSSAGLVIDPAVKNAELRQFVLATGSDGYEATFSLGELDPRFGGGTMPDLVAFAEDGQPLGTDGFARLVVPGDAAGGRYVSNLVSLQVFDATMPSPVPLPGTFALMLSGLACFALFGRTKAARRTNRQSHPE